MREQAARKRYTDIRKFEMSAWGGGTTESLSTIKGNINIINPLIIVYV